MRLAPQHVEHEELMARIERRHRLVGEQDRRLRGQRPREQDAGALAAGQLGRRPVREAAQPGGGHGGRNRFLASRRQTRAALAMRHAPERDDAPHRDRPGDAAVLRQVGDRSRPLGRGE